ncbi:MAG: hypothetical protein HXS54_06515 [Theionarchaea archaeon]|nr:hypothetical protein [Theionarchaea archaeon]
MYQVLLITPDRKDELLEELKNKVFYEKKAELAGTCIKLNTDNHEFKDMWEDNFRQMSDYVRPHGRIFALSDDEGFRVLYEPVSKTCFIFNSDYYGWVKSLALAVAGDFLEEYVSIHSRHSVHGAAIDFKGRGVSIIAPSGMGKTTHSYGLLLKKGARLVSDDWYYTRIMGEIVLARASEMNYYIREDIASIYPEFEVLVETRKLDKQGRTIADIREVLGVSRAKDETCIEKVILLKRDPEDELYYELSGEEALTYIVDNDFCNPHQLVRDERKLRIRKKFFEQYFDRVETFMVNTVTPPQETQKTIRNIVFGPNSSF